MAILTNLTILVNLDYSGNYSDTPGENSEEHGVVSIGDPTGPYGTQDHKGPYGMGPYGMGPYGTIIDHAGPYWIIQERTGDQIRPYETVRTIRDHTSQFARDLFKTCS